ncbi:MAG: hypothetical protein WC955_11605, partial [Elusimicrobiota bacterium]
EETPSLKYTLYYDTTPPVSKITVPSNNTSLSSLTSITGTANGDLSGIESVSISIQRTEGIAGNSQYWSYYSGTWVEGSTWCPTIVTAGTGNKTWTYAISDSAWTSGTRYRIISRGKDRAGNYDVTLDTVTYIYDTTVPETAFTKPDQQYYGSSTRQLLTISGTSADNPAGGVLSEVEKVYLRVKRTPGDLFWDNTTWVSNSSTWVVVNATMPWTYASDTLWNDGYRYDLNSKAVDFAANLSGWTTSTFWYDTTTPITKLLKPSSNWQKTLSTISGTALDPGSATYGSKLAYVKVAVQKNPPTGDWFNPGGTGDKFVEGTTYWITAYSDPLDSGSTVTWTLTGASTPSWINGGNYLVNAYSYDQSLNQSAYVGMNFTFDQTEPEVGLLVPSSSKSSYNALPTISGTAVDMAGSANGQIEYVQVRVYDVTNTQWYSRGLDDFTSSITDPETAWFVATNTSSWEVWYATFTKWSSGRYYEVSTRVLDKAGWYCINYSTKQFLYDVSNPEIAVTKPANAEYWKSIGTISGTAQDKPYPGNNSGTNNRRIAVRENPSMLWWDGSAFTGNNPEATYFSIGTGDGSWTYYSAALQGMLQSGCSYYISNKSFDYAENYADWYNVQGSTFVYDNTLPSSRITLPAAAQVYYSALPTISGTSTDVIPSVSTAPFVSGMKYVKFTINDNTSGTSEYGKYWEYPSGGWSVSTVSTWTAITADSWVTWYSTDVPNAQWKQGHEYNIRAWAVDNALPLPGNEQVVQEKYFRFDSSAPVAYFESPANNTYYSSLASITGTAIDYPLSPLYRSGMQKVEIMIYRVFDGYYWNGSWVSSEPGDWPDTTMTGDTQGTVNWTYNSPVWESGKEYRVSIKGTDSISVVSSSRTYTVYIDTHAPTSIVTRPVEDTGYSTVDPLTTLSGTTADYWTGSASFKYANIDSNGVKMSIRLDEEPYGEINNTDKWWKWWTSSGTWESVSSYSEDNVLFTANVYNQSDNVSYWRLAAPEWVSGKRYQIRMKTNDTVNNYETPVSSRSFTVDIIPPEAKITYPVDSGFYNTMPTISGTTSDDAAGPSYTELIIWNATDNQYWHGPVTKWVVNTSSWVRTTNLTSANTWWQYTDTPSPWTSKKVYRIIPRGVDKAGNVQVVYSTISFQMDTLAPETTVQKPVNNVGYNDNTNAIPQLYGSIADDYTGVSAAYVAIQDLNTGKYFDGAGFNTTGVDWRQATLSSGATFWYYGTPAITLPWQSSHRYLVLSKGVDPATNDGTEFAVGYSSNTFWYDNQVPSAKVTIPISSGTYKYLATLSGTVTDDYSGVTETKLKISYLLSNDTYYWTGVKFDSESVTEVTAVVNTPGSTSTTWSYTDADLEGSNGWTSQVTYRVQARAKDTSENWESVGQMFQFLYDKEVPVTYIIKPVVGVYYGPNNTLPYVSGTAVDVPVNSYANIRETLLRVKRGSDDLYLAVSSWTSTSDTWILTSSTQQANSQAEWSVAQPYNNWQNGVQYSLNTRALDLAGNLSGWTTRTFVYDSSAPYSAVLQPNTEYEPAPLSTLSGTASDPGTVGLRSELKEVKVAVRYNPPSGNYWDGSGFNQPDVQWLSAQQVGGTWLNWMFTGSTPTWENGMKYEFREKAVDYADNESTVQVSTFVYDNTQPTIGLALPYNQNRYNNLPTISGTANDEDPDGAGEKVASWINRVELRIKKLTVYWNNSINNWDSGLTSEQAWVVVQSSVTPMWSVWNTTFTAWEDGFTYEINARAYDNAQNLCVAYTTWTFVYDVTAPQSYVTLPSSASIRSSVTTLSGTAADIGATAGNVTQVRLFVRDNSISKYWDPYQATPQFSANAPVWVSDVPTGGEWDYTHASLNSALTTHVSYYLQTQAYDDAGNIESSYTVRSITFWVDKTEPDSIIILPSSSSLNVLTTISGTADDYLAKVGQVVLAIRDVTQGTTYWNGVDNWQNGEYWINTTTTNVSPVNWIKTTGLPAWQHAHQYTMYSKSKDNAAPAVNEETSVASFSFTYDISKPTSVVTYPSNNAKLNVVPVIEGTAKDEPAGITYMYVAVREAPTGPWWNGSSTFNATSVVYSTAALSGSGPIWSWTWQCPTLRDGYTYLLSYKSKDVATNEESAKTDVQFSYDITAPVSAVITPAHNSIKNVMATITGTASDVSGIQKIEVAVQANPPTGKWWTGTTFTADAELWYNAEDTNWKWTSGSANYPIWESGKNYLVKSRAYDLAGNTETVTTTGLDETWFDFDNVVPVSTVTYPVPGVIYSAISSISGTVYDDYSGPNSMRLKVYNETDNRYWDGSSFILDSTWVAVSNVYQTSWTYTTTVAWSSGKRYQVLVEATDRAANTETDLPSYDTRFSYDYTRPNSFLTLPETAKYYHTVQTVSGTAEDTIPTGGALSAGVESNFNGVAILDKTIRKWWNGSSFGSDTAIYENVYGATSWTYAFDNTRWTDGHQYLVISRAKDKSSPALEETEVTVGVDSNTFICDMSTPTSKITLPADWATINTLTTISGTSTDTASSSGVRLTKAGVYNQTSALWWDGNDFTGSEQYFDASSLSSGNTVWAYTGFESKLVTHSTYTVYTKAYDNALPLPGNYETVLSSVNFRYDITKPTSVITGISSNMKSLTTVSGTSYDKFGVGSVKILVRNLTYSATYWQGGSSWNSNETWHTVTDKENWNTSVIPAWVDGVTYQVKSRAIDNASNEETPGYSVTFNYDTTRPLSRVTYPANSGYYSSVATLSGTASDSFSGIQYVKVIIKCTAGDAARLNKYYNGSGSWVSDVQELDTTWVSAESKWYRSTGLPSWVNNEQYQIQCKAYDNAENSEIEPLDAGSTWRNDQTAPSAEVVLPEMPEKAYHSIPTITGTANDTYGITRVETKIFDTIATRTWNQATNGGLGAWDDGDQETWNLANGSSTAGGTITWTYISTGTEYSWTNSRTYRVNVRSKDLTGTYQTGYSTSTFIYDIAAPIAAVTNPVGGSKISSLSTISGTSRDYETVTNIVKMRIFRNSDGKYWDRISETWGTDNQYFTITGNGSGEITWSYTTPAFYNTSYSKYPALTSGTSYTLDIEVRDNTLPAPPNIALFPSTCTFWYDNTAPVSRIQFPADGQAYSTVKTLTTISGTAYDSTAGIKKVQITLRDLTGGTSLFFKSDGNWEEGVEDSYWLDISTVAPGGVTVNWSYWQAALSWTDGHYYRLRSRGYDNIDNTETSISSNTYIYDVTKPTSVVNYPVFDTFYEDIGNITGTAADSSNALNNSGVKSNGTYIALVMDLNENGEVDTITPDKVWDWNASTWTNYTGSLVTNNWGQCSGGTTWSAPSMSGKWVTGNLYLVKSQATDNADNQQENTQATWKRFGIAYPARSFRITVNTAYNAGTQVGMTLEALDEYGNRARSYQSTVSFTVDGVYPVGQGPEYSYVSTTTYQPEQGWLPKNYEFRRQDQGLKEFSITITSESLKLAKSGTRELRVTDVVNTTIFGTKNITVSHATPEKMRVLVPGQSRIPGQIGGVSGSPTGQTAGDAFTVTVDACDKYWNIATSTSTTVRMTASDSYDTPVYQDKALVSAGGLIQGTTTFSVTLVQRGNHTITAQDVGGTNWTAHTNTGNIALSPSVATKLQVLLPNESADWGKTPYDSNTGGKSGSVTNQTAGVAFTVTVNACDYYWNRKDDVTADIQVVTSDSYDVHPATRTLVSGTTTFNVTLVTASTQYVYATVYNGTSLSSGTSLGVVVRPNTALKLLVLLPGETADPGKANEPETNYYGQAAPFGKSGNPSAMTAGTTYYVTVNLVDKYFNKHSTATMPVVRIVTSDANDETWWGSEYSAGLRAQLSNGTKTYAVRMITSGGQSVQATDTGESDPATSYTSDQSPTVTVNAGEVKKLRVVALNQAVQPGTTEGKAGSVLTHKAGEAFTVSVNACDE